MEKIKKNRMLFYSIILVTILIIIDQTSKILIVQNKANITLIENILELTYVENTGGAFGVGQNSTLTFIVTNFVVLGIITRFIYLQRELIDKPTLNILLVILAGGFGNLIDRIFRGFVVDFISIFPSTNFPKFNFADMFITIGWIALAFVFALNTYKEIKANKGVDYERYNNNIRSSNRQSNQKASRRDDRKIN